MAKKPKARKKTVPSLKAAITKSLKAAKALRGKVAEKGDLDGTSTWARKFTIVSQPTSRASRKR